MAQEITIYKGDTFYANGLYRDANGDPVDFNIADILVEAYLKASNGKQFDLTVTFTSELGHYQLEGSTDDWPLGRHQLVIRYTQDGIKRTAEPVVVDVEWV